MAGSFEARLDNASGGEETNSSAQLTILLRFISFRFLSSSTGQQVVVFNDRRQARPLGLSS